MFDARDLLGRLMESQMRGSTSGRIGHALGPQGLGSGGNPLGDLLGGLLGGRTGASGGLGSGLGGASSGPGGSLMGGGLGDLARRAEEMMGARPGAVQGTLQDKNQLAMGGLAALAGAVLGGRRGGMGGALGGGLMALLGSLAFSALKNRPSGGTATAPTTAEIAKEAPLGLREPQTPAEEVELQNSALLAIRAMISAAKADGAIDGGEMSRIMEKLNEGGADDEARDFVMTELQKSLDLDGLIRGVKSKEQAVQVYGASLLAIEVDTPAERDYLDRLAKGLGLDGETVERIHSAFGLTRVS